MSRLGLWAVIFSSLKQGNRVVRAAIGWWMYMSGRTASGSLKDFECTDQHRHSLVPVNKNTLSCHFSHILFLFALSK